MMRPLRLRDLTRQKLSQNTVRERGDPRPEKRRADAATHTGMHVPVFVMPCHGTTGAMSFTGEGGRRLEAVGSKRLEGMVEFLGLGSESVRCARMPKNIGEGLKHNQMQHRVIRRVLSAIRTNRGCDNCFRNYGDLLTRAIDEDEIRTNFDHQGGGVQTRDQRREHRRVERLPNLCQVNTHTHRKLDIFFLFLQPRNAKG